MEKKQYVLGWPVVPSIWYVKLDINLSRQKLLAFKDVGFQLQQREALSPRHRLFTIVMLPISRKDFYVPLNPNAHPTSRFGKSVRRKLAATIVDHRNKWENVRLIHGYYVVGIISIPYLGFGVLINIISKEDITYCVTIGDMPYCTCPDFTKMSS